MQSKAQKEKQPLGVNQLFKRKITK